VKARRRIWVLGTGAAAFAVVAAAVVVAANGSLRARFYVRRVAPEDVAVVESRIELRGPAHELEAIGLDALPVVLPLALEETGAGRTPVYAEIAVRIALHAVPQPRDDVEDSDVRVTTAPREVLGLLVGWLGSTSVERRRRALGLLAVLADARTFEALVRNVRRVTRGPGSTERESGLEGSDALGVLRMTAEASGRFVRDRAGGSGLERPWSDFGAADLGDDLVVAGSRGVRLPPAAATLVTDEQLDALDAWLERHRGELPEQVGH
jgi:hypothetical protein